MTASRDAGHCSIDLACCHPSGVGEVHALFVRGFRAAFIRVEVLKECDAGRRKSPRGGENARPASHASNPTLRAI